VTEPRPGAGAVAGPGSDAPAGRRSLVPILALSAAVAFVLAIAAVTLSPGIACACTPTGAPTATPVSTLPPSPVDGVIVHIDATDITTVRGFDLRTNDGRTITFVLGALENPTSFPPGHLAEHQATSSPVRVYFSIQGGAPTVYRLEDAPPAAT